MLRARMLRDLAAALYAIPASVRCGSRLLVAAVGGVAGVAGVAGVGGVRGAEVVEASGGKPEPLGDGTSVRAERVAASSSPPPLRPASGRVFPALLPAVH